MVQSAGSLTVYSIGHSNHDLATFFGLLQRHGVRVLVDVRSQPYSRWVPDYNREMLQRGLEAAGFAYVFMGDSLGGRPNEAAMYDRGPAEGRPNYERVAQSELFQAGIDDLIQRAAIEPLAIMCSEGDHRQCHRALLITPSLLEKGVRVLHIQPDGDVFEGRLEPKQLSLF